jgi:hypothetical protein
LATIRKNMFVEYAASARIKRRHALADSRYMARRTRIGSTRTFREERLLTHASVPAPDDLQDPACRKMHRAKGSGLPHALT